ncbi:hypothetical protein C4579_01205 [Candidatus Microgenomates bacterium]|nr:MAG: hypothetical protein C4579_01205 [Candidatus Microgenomates bacterium]
MAIEAVRQLGVVARMLIGNREKVEFKQALRQGISPRSDLLYPDNPLIVEYVGHLRSAGEAIAKVKGKASVVFFQKLQDPEIEITQGFRNTGRDPRSGPPEHTGKVILARDVTTPKFLITMDDFVIHTATRLGLSSEQIDQKVREMRVSWKENKRNGIYMAQASMNADWDLAVIDRYGYDATFYLIPIEKDEYISELIEQNKKPVLAAVNPQGAQAQYQARTKWEFVADSVKLINADSFKLGWKPDSWGKSADELLKEIGWEFIPENERQRYFNGNVPHHVSDNRLYRQIDSDKKTVLLSVEDYRNPHYNDPDLTFYAIPSDALRAQVREEFIEQFREKTLKELVRLIKNGQQRSETPSMKIKIGETVDWVFRVLKQADYQTRYAPFGRIVVEQITKLIEQYAKPDSQARDTLLEDLYEQQRLAAPNESSISNSGWKPREMNFEINPNDFDFSDLVNEE